MTKKWRPKRGRTLIQNRGTPIIWKRRQLIIGKAVARQSEKSNSEAVYTWRHHKWY